MNYPTTGEIDVHVGRYVVRIRPHGETDDFGEVGFSWFVADYPTNARQCPTQNSCGTFKEARDKGIEFAKSLLRRLP